MPLPFIIGAAAAIAGVVGVGAGISGGVKMKEAKDTMESANSRHERNLRKFEDQNKKTTEDMDKLGMLELKILDSFKTFSDVFEKIHNKPEFKEYKREGVKIPEYNGEKLKEVSVSAGVVLGGIGGAALGTAGGFAAAGATTSAVMAVGTASTGTAISSLSGAAATNAILATLGGGTLAEGAGGVALGTAILNGATLGVGLLVSGVIFNIAGSSLSDKADEAWDQMISAEKKINHSCTYMRSLSSAAECYIKSLDSVDCIYQDHLQRLQYIVYDMGKTDWNKFTKDEKLCTENTVLLVGLLNKMCDVKMVLKAENQDELGTVNISEVNKSMADAKQFLASRDFTLG